MAEWNVAGSLPSWTEADRLAALRGVEILDTEPESAFDDIVGIAGRVCQAPIAAITFIDERRQWFKAEIGLGVRETPLDISICAHAILQPGLFVVPDTTKDPRFSRNPLVTGEPLLRFYAGALLETDEGLPLGMLCVLDRKPRPDGITPDQAETLLALARAVMSHLKLRQANKALREHQGELTALTDILPQIIWSAGPDGRDDYNNRQWYEFTGAEPGSAEGDDWASLVHPEDRDRAVALWRQSLQSGEPYECEYRLHHHSGEYRWVLSRGTPVQGARQEVRRWYGTNTDIHEWKQAEEALARSEKRYRALIEATAVVVWVATPDGMIIETRGWEEITGQSDREAAGLGSVDTLHPDDTDRITRAWLDAVASGAPYEAECRVRQKNGEYRWMLTRAVPIRNPDGSIREWVGGLSDIHDRKQAEEELRASEERLRLAFQAGRMFAWEQDLTTSHVTRSQHTVEWLGIGSGPISEFVERVHPEDRYLRQQFLERILESGSSTMEFRYLLPGGKLLWLGTRGERAGPNRVVGVTFDITDRKSAEEEIWRIANHDPLTGLPNRMLAQKRLEQGLAEAKQHGTSFSLLVIDLDEFKDVNDSFGHDAGDALLTETAARLAAVARDCDTVARLGGDEFVVLLARSSLEHAATLAEGIARKLSQPVSYAGQMIASRASIGVAAFPDHAAEAADLMKDADMALYRAKTEGRNRVVTFSPDMRAATEQRTTLRREMREAVSLDQIKPFYQPKVCLSTGEIVGFEALARWEHPARGLLTPGTFGAIFDDPELATMVGKRLIGKVASDMRRWLNSGLSFGHVAINLSHVEFIQPGLAEEILRILDLAKVPPKHFEIEITERVLLDAQSDAVSSALEKFRARGVQIALDDFGTGYASLTHLKQFSVDHIKIDQSFVRDIEEDPDDEAIVTAVISLGRSLNLKVTAEGVETTGQAQRLREMGCSAAQGYLYAKPIGGSEVPELLSSWSPQQISAKRLLLVER
jgi:diguanylate cyclase (GGDEF)-like protein/PAS domain S-box-containing protein